VGRTGRGGTERGYIEGTRVGREGLYSYIEGTRMGREGLWGYGRTCYDKL
tara:strand:- start:2096 stop:2245 length:150 start_codon:yes stop_codon:yes gene_type:complete